MSIFYCKEVFTTYDKGIGHELRETKDGGIIYLGDDITLTEAQAIRLTLFPNQAHRGHTTLRDKGDIQLTVADRCLHLLVVRLETDALLVGQEYHGTIVQETCTQMRLALRGQRMDIAERMIKGTKTLQMQEKDFVDAVPESDPQ